jgi:hypothetical protein
MAMKNLQAENLKGCFQRQQQKGTQSLQAGFELPAMELEPEVLLLSEVEE